MPICNKITKEQIHEINERLQKQEKEFYKRDDAKKYPDRDNWEVLEDGMKKIENSPTKHLLFAHADYSDDESKETLENRESGLSDYEISDETRNAINEDIMKKFGMSLDEFTKLDSDKQTELIEKYHGKKMGVDNSLYIGGGVCKTLVTSEELDERLQEMDKAILEENEILEDKSKVKTFKKK